MRTRSEDRREAITINKTANSCLLADHALPKFEFVLEYVTGAVETIFTKLSRSAFNHNSHT